MKRPFLWLISVLLAFGCVVNTIWLSQTVGVLVIWCPPRDYELVIEWDSKVLIDWASYERKPPPKPLTPEQKKRAAELSKMWTDEVIKQLNDQSPFLGGDENAN